MRGDKPPGSVRLALGTNVVRIEPDVVVLKDSENKETRIPNDVVFTMLGREAPLEFLALGTLHSRRVETAGLGQLPRVCRVLLFSVYLEGEQPSKSALPGAQVVPI